LRHDLYHHAVHKNALLFSAKLKQLARVSSDSYNYGSDENKNLPDDFLEGITKVLSDIWNKVSSNEVSDMFLQLDDSWLDRVIVKSGNVKKHSGVANSLVSLSKDYRTIFKGFYDFKNIDECIYKRFDARIKETGDAGIFKAIEHQDRDFEIGQAMYNIINRLRKVKHIDYDTYYSRSHKFFLNSTISHLNHYLSLECSNEPDEEKYIQYTKRFFRELGSRLFDEYDEPEDCEPKRELQIVILAKVSPSARYQ